MKNLWNVWLSMTLVEFLRYDLDILVVWYMNKTVKISLIKFLSRTVFCKKSRLCFFLSEVKYNVQRTKPHISVTRVGGVYGVYQCFTHLATIHSLANRFRLVILGETNNITLGPSQRQHEVQVKTLGADKTLERNCNLFNKTIKRKFLRFFYGKSLTSFH